ncbi:MAG: phosphotransferase [Oscillochloris sp.]|nr:phosphotransferase [Oscillochloris sp.]
MSSATEPLSYVYHLIVAAPTAPKVLVMPVEQSWYLPGFQHHERRFWQDVDHVNRRAEALLGGPMQTLRCVAIDYEREQELLSKVYAIAPHDPRWTPPPGGRWVGPDDLEALELVPGEHRMVLADWFAWRDQPTPPTRPPWYSAGWLDLAVEWAVAQLEGAGMTPSGPAEQLRSWQRSALLRLPTQAGNVYVKAVPPLFAHEPELTALLATIAPQHVPATIAVDRRRGLLLTREYAGVGLDRVPEVADWAAALRSFAELQIACIAQVDRLRAVGVPLRSLASLPTRAAPLLADMAAMVTDRPAGLNHEQRDRLIGLGPQLADRCAALAAFGLPETLEHGDFWAGQIIVGASGYIVLDWSDSSIAHPFFSLLLFLLEVEDFFPKERGVRERLRDAYLGPWSAIAPYRDLVRAFELAQPLAALHFALSYYEDVLPQMEQRWEMELMLPFYLKMLLRLADW